MRIRPLGSSLAVAAAESGIWRSDDEDKNWTRINDDVHRFADGGVLAAGPTEYGTVYVARGAGGIVVGKIAQ